MIFKILKNDWNQIWVFEKSAQIQHFHSLPEQATKL